MPVLRPFSAIVAALALLPAVALAQDWALGGMDAVAYQADGQAREGRSDLVTEWQGLSWHFASERNRALFEANPRAFVPAFDGYCVVSLSEGRIEPGDPRAFVVHDGQLYLMRSLAAREQFLAGATAAIALAQRNYGRLH